MQVLVKSWKNATEQHKGSKTNENACIKFELTFICLNLYYIIHCTSVCDEDEYELNAAVSSVHHTDGAPNRLARGMLKEKAHYKNSEPLGFPTHDPQAEDVRGVMLCKCIIDRRK